MSTALAVSRLFSKCGSLCAAIKCDSCITYMLCCYKIIQRDVVRIAILLLTNERTNESDSAGVSEKAIAWSEKTE